MVVDQDRYNIKGIERGFRILDLAAARGSIGIPDVCEVLEVNTNMAFRLLTSIQKSGYLVKEERTGLYTLSLKILSLSNVALQSLEIRKFAMPYMEILWSNFQKANVNLGMKNGDDILIIERIEGLSLPRTYFTPGKQIPFHCSGLGKVLCCELSEEELDRLIKEKGLKAYTAHTIVDPDEIKKELARVREEGVGRDRNEFIFGDNCSAVPIRNKAGEIVAGISASALDANMCEEEIEGMIPRLKETASRISGMLGYITV
ncbi:MAG: IclR family transcriptional regulator [Spirochaetales bacterium]|nr:IclR family transcriptional regulator [Spirochaetales bacterium]